MSFDLSPFPEHMRPAMQHALDRKNELVARAGPDENDDLVPSVDVFRNERFLAGILAPQIDRDLALAAANIAIPGFNAEAVIVTLDAHLTQNVTHNDKGESVWTAGPRKGHVVRQHEMQTMCDEEGACEIGLITDCLIVMRVDREGVVEQGMLPYHVHKTARTVAWQEHAPDGKAEHLYWSTAKEDQGAAGVVPETILGAFKEEPLLDVKRAVQVPPEKVAEVREGLKNAGFDPEHLADMIPDDGKVEMPAFGDFGLDREEAQIHADCAVVRILAQQQFAVGYFPQSEKAAEIFTTSMERQSDVQAEVIRG